MGAFLAGFGSPLVDYSVCVTDDFLTRNGISGKGGTQNISVADREKLLAGCVFPVVFSPGGAAANTAMAAAKAGVPAAFAGFTGDDEPGRFWIAGMKEAGVDTANVFADKTKPTGFCLAMITPDAERTMRSDLGASVAFTAETAAKFDFSGVKWLLAEGYFINHPALPQVIKAAKKAGCRVALDLCSFELAGSYSRKFMELISGNVDMLFANRDEAVALTGRNSPAEAVQSLMSSVSVAVVKCGADGSMIGTQGEIHNIPAEKTLAVDTTAAGDYYAAGFFWGLYHHLPPAQCGRAGAVMAAEIVGHQGTQLDRAIWEKLNARLEQLKCNTK